MTQGELKPMPLARFAELLDAYGGDAKHWPEHERQAALSLLASDARAVELQRAARLLDEQLDRVEAHAASAHLQARVLEIPIRHQPAPQRRFWLPGWAIAGLALVPCVLGFLSGSMSASEPDEGWNEVASLTLLGDDVAEEDWP